MSWKCERCGSVMRNAGSVCSTCGLGKDDLPMLPKGAYKIPQTITELKQFCEVRGMPLKKMRFFIGEDYREPRAFGIYQDEDGQFVVYKNKSNGERAIRYRGSREDFAVHELYEKLKSETEIRRKKNASYGKIGGGKRIPSYISQSGKIVLASTIIMFLMMGLVLLLSLLGHHIDDQKYGKRGYYEYNDTAYYHVKDDWYYYDTNDYGWTPTESPFSDYEDERTASEDAYVGKDYDGDSFYTDWNKSVWYDNYFSSSASSDSGWSSSDYDSWDSSDTDWDSDW